MILLSTNGYIALGPQNRWFVEMLVSEMVIKVGCSRLVLAVQGWCWLFKVGVGSSRLVLRLSTYHVWANSPLKSI